MSQSSSRLVDQLVSACENLGIQWAFGLVGGAISPLCDALAKSRLHCVSARHEGGAGFQALEASIALDAPTLVFTTTGPGLINALNAAFAAKVEGARVLFLSGATSAAQRGRGAVQELSDSILARSSDVVRDAFHMSVTVEHPAQLASALQRVATGFSRPEGFVAHIALPLGVQVMPTPPVVLSGRTARARRTIGADISSHLQGQTLLVLGHGARRSVESVRALAEHLGSVVVSTPHGKGIFPEDHPQFAGVAGFGGHDAVFEAIDATQPTTSIVIGSRLGEFSSIWDNRLLPGTLVHVDPDDEAFHVGFPDRQAVNVVATADEFCHHAIVSTPSRKAPVLPKRVVEPLSLRADGPVRPDRLMQAIQAAVVEHTDAVVFAEPGNSFAWATHHLRFATPRYRMSGFWASMGHQVTGAVGAALVTDRRCVVITGDGSMLMQNEISTAVAHQAKVTWIVLNDASFGITEHGMKALGYRPLDPRFPRVDFAAFAASMGARGTRVHTEAELEDGLSTALAAPGPTLLDVIVDNESLSPFIRRIEALKAMGARA